MTNLANYYALFFVAGLLLMALFVRFYLRRRSLRRKQPNRPEERAPGRP